MVNIDVLKVLNEYYMVLRKTCGTFGRNELNKMCLLPLLQDIVDGLITPYLTDSDEAVVNKFIKECFSSLIGKGNVTPTKTYLFYSGTSNYYPTDNVILNVSTKYVSSETKITSPTATGNYFWVAIPKEFTLGSAKNVSVSLEGDPIFEGDYIPYNWFTSFDTTLNDIDYVVYYTQSVIPLNSAYSITINRN